MAIKWTKDGPVGVEDVRFSPLGVRLAIVTAEGEVEQHDQWDLSVFGGVLPAVGDYMTVLWPSGDSDPNEHHRVLARYYLSEFAGDTCWWLLIAPEPASERDLAVFDLMRASSKETRERAKAAFREAMAVAAALKSTGRTKQSGKRLTGRGTPKKRTAR